MSDPYIIGIEKIKTEDFRLVGGKGYNLGFLAAQGFPVPPGYCLTSHAYDCFLAGIPELPDLFSGLKRAASHHTETKKLGGKIRELMADSPVPEPVRDAVLSTIAEPALFYAVRSSATAEDLPTASFAGQQDTFLNITGLPALLTHIRLCWASLFTERAILYRNKNHFSHDSVKLCVIIQQMIPSERSGILFTADPLSGNRDIITIDAGFGLGEALVSGLITPDNYRIHKQTKQILNRTPGKKQVMIRPLQKGGTEKVEVTEKEKAVSVLDPEEIRQLTELAIRVEACYGTPQDIEWASTKKQFHILQSRPITSLFPAPEPSPENNLLHVYLSFGHVQMMTNPFEPMGLSLLRHMLRLSKRRKKNPQVCSAAGRIFLDISPLCYSSFAGQFYSRVLQEIDRLMASALEEFTNREELRKAQGKNREARKVFKLLPFLLHVVLKTQLMVWFKKPERQGTVLHHWINKYLDSIHSRLNKLKTTSDRIQYLYKKTRISFPEFAPVLIPFVAGGIMARILIKKITGMTEEELQDLSSGLRGNVTTEMDLKVGDMADELKKNHALTTFLKQQLENSQLPLTNQFIISACGSIPGSSDFLSAWKEFMRLYGMRGPGEINICTPRWKDDASSLLRVILNRLTEPLAAHRTHYNGLVRKGEQAARELEKNIPRGQESWLKRKLLLRLVRVFRNLMALREHPKYLLIRLAGILRDNILEAGEELRQANRLENSRDVWYLDLDTLAAALQNPELKLTDTVKTAKEAWAYHNRLQPPRVLTSKGEILRGRHKDTDSPPGALPGTGVSAGIREGLARIVLEPQSATLLPGEILVAPFTDPGWTPLFINASAVVIEVGGMMTHGSVIAREYGIPAVVSVEEATKKLQTGWKIRVNGNAGYVEILDKKHEIT